MFKSWEGGKEGEGVLPHQAAAAISLSAQPQSLSSPASPVKLATGAHTSYLRVPRRAGSNTWEQFKGWSWGCADCRRHRRQPCHASCPQGHCSGAWAAPPAAATDLQHSFLPAPINLLFRSAWHRSLPHLGDAMSSHLMRTFLFTFFHTSVPGAATGVLCHVSHLLFLTIPQFPLLLHSQLSFRDKGTQCWNSALLGLVLVYGLAPKLQLCLRHCGARHEGCGSVHSNPVFCTHCQLWLFSLLPGGNGTSLWWTLQGTGITTGWL